MLVKSSMALLYEYYAILLITWLLSNGARLLTQSLQLGLSLIHFTR